MHDRENGSYSTTDSRTKVGRIGEQVPSDERGIAEFEVPPHTPCRIHAFAVRHAGSLPSGNGSADVQSLDSGEHITANLRLPTTSDVTFVGRLIAEESGSPIEAGTVTLVIGAPQFASADATQTLVIGSPPLADGGELEKPAAVPRWMIASSSEHGGEQIETAAPDSSGLFELHSASWLFWASARIDVPGRSMIFVPIRAGHASADHALTIPLTKTASVIADVSDGIGRSLSHVTVRCIPGDQKEPRWLGFSTQSRPVIAWEGTTDASGSCRIDDLPSGTPIVVELRSANELDRHKDEPLTLSRGEERRIDLVFGGTSAVRGLLIDGSNAPLPDEIVWLRRADRSIRSRFDPAERIYADARTDSQGRFMFDKLAAGEWWIGPKARAMHVPSLEVSRLLAPVAELVHVPSRGIVDVVVKSNRGLSIRGHVVAPTQEPLADVRVQATLLGAEWRESAASNGDGSFVLGPLIDGEYELTTSENYLGAGFDPITRQPRGPKYAPSRPVRVRAGNQAVVLPLQIGGRIHCTCVPDGEITLAREWDSPDNISIEIRGPKGIASGVYQGGTSSPLPSDAYTLVASSTSGLYGMASGIVVRDGVVTEVALSIRRGAKLNVRAELVNASGPQIDRYEILANDVLIAARRSELSAPMMHVIPAGRVVVRAHTSSDEWSEKVIDVSAGEARDIALKP
jgi:hypothetical protein